MKRIIALVMIVLMMTSGLSTFADSNDTLGIMPVLISEPGTQEPVPTLYQGENAVRFDVIQDGDKFTIILDENSSTGYSWIYEIKDEQHLSFITDIQTASETQLVGAPGKHEFTFTVNGEGVSTITFSYKRAWEEVSIDTLNILVYKNGDKLFVEEDKPVYAMDDVKPVLYTTSSVYYNDTQIISDVPVQLIDGIMMIPLRSTLEEMGYEVKWNGETSSVEILKGAQWTSIKIGVNAYFKNRMAQSPLSAAPVIVDGRTLVPAEFFNVILSKGLIIEEGNLKLNDREMALHSGYVKEIKYDETGMMSITLTSDMDSDDIMLQTIIHTSPAYTFMNKKVVEGEFIHVISPMMMTMSIPGQTSGYIIY
ncbi:MULTISPECIES: protease inhibitor I42 family protein [unclassified Fusibacter]|uniref:protease inhibitor I42 family protein n=1 Tax=unclassified Fusibacter TaxID=2624464 RepID=UPI00101063A1|nr:MULTISPECIES: stalk domain-containing protein [unclassified Fusibacter]MCK8060763.1 stalk domain-containing protein [Fusibacter sp. A2]NPE23059.1 hypothetical protein [Fusibacter sp. A1]RXV59731.1 hypothetical protein DWB64_14550 [Fusibacter sp. A1]